MKTSLLKKSLLYICILPLLINPSLSQTREARDSYLDGGASGAQSTTLIDTGVGLKDGEVWVWGYKGSGQQGNGISNDNDKLRAPEKVESLSDIVAVSGGAYHLIAINSEGLAWGWGLNAYGSAGCVNPKGKNHLATPCPIVGVDGKRLRLRQAVGAGEYNSIYLDFQGNVLTSGHSLYGQLGLGSPGKNTFVPEKINLQGEVARLIGAAYEGGFAVTYNGNSWDTRDQNVWAWGRDFKSSLGLYTSGNNYVWVPQKVTRLKKYANQIVKIAGGYEFGLALLNDGKLIGWGQYRSLGQSCNMSSYNSTVSPEPVEVPFPPKMIDGKLVPTTIVQMETRFESTIVLTNHNDIYTFGSLTSTSGAYRNIQGWCPKLANISEEFRLQNGYKVGNIQFPGRIVKIGAGKHHITYEMSNGTVWGVGYNAGGQIWYGMGFITDFPGLRMRDF